ncbi:MAG: hypothetical protein H6658_07050 [Ardenticatenaceae bacterium]|nr:hypothetical protein [Ardenticatenaceae bacterium]
MKKTFFLFSVILILVSTVLLGCTMVEAPSTRVLPTNTATTVVSIRSEVVTSLPTLITTRTVLDDSTSVMTSTSTIPVAVTSTPIATPLIDDEHVRICTMLPEKFNFRDALNISYITQLRFLSEQQITFEGWSPRPKLEEGLNLIPTPTVSETLPGLSPYISSRILFTPGQLDLTSGEMITRSLNFAPLLNNPCGELCPLEILSQSPDSIWQLIQVSDWSYDLIGIWLIKADEMIRVVPYVPAKSIWQWSMDNKILWYVYNRTDYGIDALTVQLASPIEVESIEPDKANPLDPSYYFLAYSPKENIVASTKDPFTQGSPDTDELYLTALETPPSILSTTRVDGLIYVAWNEATESYLLEIVQEDGVEFREWEGSKVLRIPLSTLYLLFPSLAEGNTGISELILGANYAMSPSGEYLAIVFDYGEIWVFDCQNS